MIRFESVSKVFPNGYIGLEDISFEIEPQTLTYIVGESGAGKTTLMRLLIREFEPSAGEIFFGEQPLSGLRSSQIPYLRRRIGVVFQDYKLLPDKTVYENIAFIHEIAGVPNREIREQVEKVLQLVGLEDRQDLFPVQLSGGESQRISIARALALTPEVLFADEPTGNLDPKTSAEIGELLNRIAELGTTVLVSTHDQQLLKKFSAPEIHLHQGRLIKNTIPTKKSARSSSPTDTSEGTDDSDTALDDAPTLIDELHENHTEGEPEEVPVRKKAKSKKASTESSSKEETA